MSRDSSLESVLRSVEPAVRLIPVRHLRRVINYLLDHDFRVPTNTELPFWVTREILDKSQLLPATVLEGSDSRILLITDPGDRMIDHLPREEQLRIYWRILFRAAVIAEFDRNYGGGLVAQDGTLRELPPRLDQFGAAAAREIEFVLASEHCVQPGQSALATFAMFAAVYLDLSVFERHAVELFFPSAPIADVDRVLRTMFDVPALLTRTRPPGAADPLREPPPDENPLVEPHSPVLSFPEEPQNALLLKAREAEEKENSVRAAILFMQAAAIPGSSRGEPLSGAIASLERLVDRLGREFGWDDSTRLEWLQALTPLLDLAAAGVWPRAARCLYELQTIPADLSREAFVIDLPEYLRTFGRRPVKRLLPHARPVRILMTLKKAHGQLMRARLSVAAQASLDRLFHRQIHTVEQEIRGAFSPLIADALVRAGLIPLNTVEEVARDKLIAELMDRICERGYLRLGDLRDAIARNRLKMGDSAAAFFTGDALLRADLNLAENLDGVYRKGEVYLRGLQRFSALFFANPVGRLITLFIALPFGGAFLTLMFAEEMRHIGGKIVAMVARSATPRSSTQSAQESPTAQPRNATTADSELIQADEVVGITEDGLVIVHEVTDDTVTSDDVGGVDDDGEILIDPGSRVRIVRDVFQARVAVPTEAPESHMSVLTAWPTILAVGFFLLLMIHVSPFRTALFLLLRHVWTGVRGILWDFPLRLWRSSLIRELRRSQAVRFLVRHFWSPLVITAIVFGMLILMGMTSFFLARWGWLIWAVLTLAYNTPWGWVVQDRVTEALSDWWRVVRVNLVPGLLHTIIDWFRMLVNWVERKLYAVDEWFRFRGGDSRRSILTKAILGLVWFPIAYVFRFAFYLLVEPQVNPIKHFPVVTVSHKMLLPLVVSKDPKIEASIFGEVLVNQFNLGVAEANFWAFWIIAGVPGIFGFMAWEFVANWQMYRSNRSTRLRPVMLGSHGETMRGLLRPGFHSGTIPKIFRKLRRAAPAKANRLHHELEHAAEAVHRFVERELVHLLACCPAWEGIEIRVGTAHFGCQRVCVQLLAPGLAADAFLLSFENVGGEIEAAIERSGWADKLTASQVAVFVGALRGLLDMAATDRVFGMQRSVEAPPAEGFPDLARRVTWTEWVARWDQAVAANKSPG